MSGEAALGVLAVVVCPEEVDGPEPEEVDANEMSVGILPAVTDKKTEASAGEPLKMT